MKLYSAPVTKEATLHLHHLFQSTERSPGTQIRSRGGPPIAIKIFGDVFGFLVLLLGESIPTLALEIYDWKQGVLRSVSNYNLQLLVY